MKRLAGPVFLQEEGALAVPLIDFSLQDVQPDGNLCLRCDAEQRSEGENAQEEMAKIEKLARQKDEQAHVTGVAARPGRMLPRLSGRARLNEHKL